MLYRWMFMAGKCQMLHRRVCMTGNCHTIHRLVCTAENWAGKSLAMLFVVISHAVYA